MGPISDVTPAHLLARSLSIKLRAFRVRKGWNMDRLAQTAGVSRTTVYHLERGDISRPRASTLYKLAVALEVDPAALASDSVAGDAPLSEEISPNLKRESTQRLDFDRITNNCIKRVYENYPDQFTAWSDQDWEELYSTFGVGGPLSEQGVLAIAHKINRKRETFEQLGIILETHHADVASGLIENLYQLVQAEAESAFGGSPKHEVEESTRSGSAASENSSSPEGD